MVDLIQFYSSMAQNEQEIRKKIDTIFKYLKSNDKNFAKKTILAFRELIIKKNVKKFFSSFFFKNN